MSRTKQLATVAVTFAIAMGAGYFVQNGNANASLSQQESEPVMAPIDVSAEGDILESPAVESETVATTAVSVIPSLSLPKSDKVSDQNAEVAAVDLEPLVEDTVMDVVPSAEIAELTCAAELTATPSDNAIVTLDLNAPCQKSVRAIVHHQGLHFTQLTDETGQFSVDVPALAEAAIFIVAFPNGEGAVANTTISSMEIYDRVVLQWKGDQTFEIHAREGGANYGDIGHIWHGMSESAELDQGGFLTRLGNQDVTDPLQAEIYSFPVGVSVNNEGVDLTIEAEISADNCGINVSAETLQIIGGTDATVRDIAMEMPECDALGDFLVLNNLYENLTLAQN